MSLGVGIAYSTYGAPSEFGNDTTTTCYIGGDFGVVNCTGNITGDYLSGKLNWTDLDGYPIACSSGYAVTQVGDSNVCTNFAEYNFDNNNFNGTGNITATYIKLNEVSGLCDLTVNHTICSNVTGTYIVG